MPGRGDPTSPGRTLQDLLNVIRERRRTRPAGSYVASLFRKGRPEILKKIGEEAFETSLAALGRNRKALVAEIADLWFHTLVLMADKGIPLEDVTRELDRRRGAPRARSRTRFGMAYVAAPRRARSRA